MARIARLVVPGVPHHVVQRGNRRQRVFFSDADYRRYLKILSKRCGSEGLHVWCYCLMPNHVHLLVVPEHKDALAKGLGRTHSDYARIVNHREGWQGHLWQARFASFAMDERHLFAAARYVLLNPVAAKMVRRPEDWRYSSVRAHLEGKSDGVVDVDPLGRRIEDWTAVLAPAEDEARSVEFGKQSRSGRPLGSDDFVRNIAQSTKLDFTRRPRGRPKSNRGK